MINKRKIGLLLTAVAFILTVKAQERKPVLAKAYYKFIHVNDTTQRGKHHEEEMVLYMGKDASFYGTYADERINELMIKQMEDPAFDGNLTIKGSSKITRESYYFETTNKIFKELYKLGSTQYLLEDTYPKIEWKIGNETKEVDGYHCQRADTHFKGRDYTVWFAPDLPFPYGPWKLQGLPGLILEVKDAKNEVLFHFAGFEKVNEKDMTIGVSTQFVKTSRKAIERLKEAFRKNPNAVSAAASKGKGGPETGIISNVSTSINGNPVTDPSRIKSITVQKSDQNVSAVTNNPLELTD